MTQYQDTDILETTRVSHPVTEQVVRQTTVAHPGVTSGSLQHTYETKKAIFRSYQVIWYIVGVIEALLAFRILLKLLGASTYSGFTNFIYTLSAPFALPFAGILRTSSTVDSVFEWSTVIAMIVYVVLAYGLIGLLQLIKPTTPGEVEQTIDNS